MERNRRREGTHEGGSQKGISSKTPLAFDAAKKFAIDAEKFLQMAEAGVEVGNCGGDPEGNRVNC